MHDRSRTFFPSRKAIDALIHNHHAVFRPPGTRRDEAVLRPAICNLDRVPTALVVTDRALGALDASPSIPHDAPAVLEGLYRVRLAGSSSRTIGWRTFPLDVVQTGMFHTAAA